MSRAEPSDVADELDTLGSSTCALVEQLAGSVEAGLGDRRHVALPLVVSASTDRTWRPTTGTTRSGKSAGICVRVVRGSEVSVGTFEAGEVAAAIDGFDRHRGS